MLDFFKLTKDPLELYKTLHDKRLEYQEDNQQEKRKQRNELKTIHEECHKDIELIKRKVINSKQIYHDEYKKI